MGRSMVQKMQLLKGTSAGEADVEDLHEESDWAALRRPSKRILEEGEEQHRQI